MECHKAWASESGSSRGAPLGGSTCLAGMPWRTRMPTPLADTSQTTPRFQGSAPEGLPPRHPCLGAHHLLGDCRQVGFGEEDHIRLPLSNRVPVHAQGRDVGVRQTPGPRVGVHVTAPQQQQEGEGAPTPPSQGGGEGGAVVITLAQ